MRQFSPPHLAALAVLVVSGAAAVVLPRRGVPTTSAARILALLVLAAWVGEYVVDAVNGTYSTQYTLPLQLTDVISATTVVALLTRRQLLVELLYFWALSASLQALLTPDLQQSFPSIYYFTYFIYHIGAVVAALLLVFGCGMYPRRRAALRAFGATLIWAAVAGIGDVLTDGNYMYLRAKPAHGSLLNLMGPWPWYIASTAVLALAMLLVLQLIADWAGRFDPRAVRARPKQPAPQ